MKINNEFTVGAPIDQAWNTMLDLEKIAPCLPGAAIQEETDDGEYAGTIKVKVGPITASYKGTVKFEEADEPNHRAVLQATGRDARGQGTASATIVSTLREEDGNTKVNVETDLKLTGRAAQFGRGIAQDVATRMLDQFAACLEQELSGSGNGSQASTSDSPAPAAAESTAGRIVSGEDPADAGGIVEGAVVVGSSPSGAAAGAPTTPTQQPTTQDASRQRPAEEPEAFDPGDAGQGAVLGRLTPVLAGAGILLVLIWIFRRRS